MTIDTDLLIKAAHYPQLKGENIALKSQVAQLREQNRQLSKRIHESGLPMRQLHQAYEDALLILSLEAASLPTSRRYCDGLGVPRRRWQRARQLLHIARAEGEQAAKIAALQDAYKQLQAHPKALRRPCTPAPRKRTHKMGSVPRHSVPTAREKADRGGEYMRQARDRRTEIEARHNMARHSRP